MDKKLVEFFENKDFEVVEKKTTTQVLIQNLLAFSVREKKGGLFDISINIVKEDEEKEKLRKHINREGSSENEGWNIDFEKTPILHNVTVSQFEDFCKQTKIIAQVKRLSEFREVQSDFTLAIAKIIERAGEWQTIANGLVS